MFKTNFKPSCLATTPFFYTLIMIGISAVVIITMESAFRYFDVTSDGKVSLFCLNWYKPDIHILYFPSIKQTFYSLEISHYLVTIFFSIIYP